jgi:hypothetical protein
MDLRLWKKENVTGLPPAAKKENYMNQNSEPLDLQPSNGQIPTRAFHYKIIVEGSSEPFFVTVIAPNATSARAGLEAQPAFRGKTTSYYGVSDYIIQVNN